MNERLKSIQIDIEWVKLIHKARALGLTKEEVRLFLTEFKKDSVYK